MKRELFRTFYLTGAHLSGSRTSGEEKDKDLHDSDWSKLSKKRQSLYISLRKCTRLTNFERANLFQRSVLLVSKSDNGFI